MIPISKVSHENFITDFTAIEMHPHPMLAGIFKAVSAFCEKICENLN
jgi:hypothetical protein